MRQQGLTLVFVHGFGSCTQETLSQLPEPTFKDQTWDLPLTSAITYLENPSILSTDEQLCQPNDITIYIEIHQLANSIKSNGKSCSYQMYTQRGLTHKPNIYIYIYSTCP